MCFQPGSITKNLEGEGLSEMAELAQAGVSVSLMTANLL